MDLWSAQLVLTHHLRHQLHPSLLHQHPESRVKIFLFYPWCFSLAGCLFPFFSQAKSCFSAFPFWVNSHEISPFIRPTGPPLWLPQLLSHLSGIRTVPCPLALRLLASAELQLYLTSLPRLIVSRTIWSEWTRSRWSPSLAAGCSLSA